MSVIFTLPSWVHEHVQQIYAATTDKDFDQAFDAFVAPNATIRVNGHGMSRDQYKKLLRGETSSGPLSGQTGGEVSFKDTVSVVNDKDKPVQTGSVGVAFKATVFKRFFIFGHRQSDTIHSSLNVEVAEERPTESPPSGDYRRVSVLNEVFTDHANNPLPTSGNSA